MIHGETIARGGKDGIESDVKELHAASCISKVKGDVLSDCASKMNYGNG